MRLIRKRRHMNGWEAGRHDRPIHSHSGIHLRHVCHQSYVTNPHKPPRRPASIHIASVRATQKWTTNDSYQETDQKRILWLWRKVPTIKFRIVHLIINGIKTGNRKAFHIVRITRCSLLLSFKNDSTFGPQIVFFSNANQDWDCRLRLYHLPPKLPIHYIGRYRVCATIETHTLYSGGSRYKFRGL